MDEENQKPEPKISLVEMILIGLFLLVLDLIDLIPLAGDITDILAAPLIFYYFMKGLSGTTYIIGWALDFIPGIQEFPLRSIAWWITVWVDHHPKLESKLEATGSLVQGNVEGVEQEAGRLASTAGKAAGAAEEAGAAAKTGAAAEMGEATEGVKTGADAAGTEAEGGGNKSSKEKSGKPSEEPTEKEKRTAKEFKTEENEMEIPDAGERKVEEENRDGELASGITGEERALLGEKGRLNEELFEQPMQIPRPPEMEGEQLKQNSKKEVGNEEFRTRVKMQDVKRQQEKLKPTQQVPLAEEENEEDDLEKAA